uniref:NTR domain-containing protein n=1 Tax=Meloidogyne hapla TaxID=6305 RepID=A0A1I8BDL6_MELHA
MPGSFDQQTNRNVRYKVKYEQMFKISCEMKVTEQNLVVLPVNIYTSSDDSACGIQLEIGHDYLLSGKYINGTMQTSLCGQILLEDLKESRKHDILEWTEVPDKLKQQLNKQEFDSTCEKQPK